MAANVVDPNLNPITIREVWAQNLNSEFKDISSAIDQYPCISMDTEYPGVIFKPAGDYLMLSQEEKYELLKSNVDALNLIQLGITLSDADGNLPELEIGNRRVRVVWQFNFSDFDLTRDKHAPDSIKLLINHGINFEANQVSGIKSFHFSELLMSSGLVLNESVSWVTFQGGYDIGYLLKILTRRELPREFDNFLEYARVFLGNNFYDVKHLMGVCNLYGGLNWVASALGLNRVAGRQHQAGSDSLLTCHVFYRMRNNYFVDGVPDRHSGRFAWY
ncbi:probable CCR4-associated factor 1 homolog 11 [Solanum dulcamara]|uniref:probable CCR4-associated factor 1 homolog 11 n=1 Tax=Solanum dulcamara TaxID=45834 RepID=UPI00248528B2|nr:probable CCR4-associated factor 1 homolog 11 [Solanum dulcamara]